jgi:hypothetical protein
LELFVGESRMPMRELALLGLKRGFTDLIGGSMLLTLAPESGGVYKDF